MAKAAKASAGKKATGPKRAPKAAPRNDPPAAPEPVVSAVAIEPAAPAQSGEARRERDQERSRKKSNERREVGPPNPPADPARKLACRDSFRLFCETYLAEWFFLGWGPDHLKAIEKIEGAVLRGERFAFAMPRGSGKTTLCEAASLWALLYEHRRFLLIIGADSGAAVDIMNELKEELETNDRIDEDFNEVTRYVRALEGIGQRANGQTADGERTRIEWTDQLVRFPVTARRPKPCVIKVAGITGRIRGMKIKGHRPDLCILDDPQTDESADSLSMTRARLRVVAKAVLGLAGPKKQIAALMPCTVIVPGDMADQILDPAKFPRWRGERFKMVYHFPLDAGKWGEYAELLAEVGGEARATALYVAHRAAMDRGAVLAWPDRFPDEKVSAVQHAMDLLIDNRAAFMAECQNEPEDEELDGDVIVLDAGKLAAKVTKLGRGIVPRDTVALTAGIDVQGGCHFATVTAWDAQFGGSVIDRVTFPPQARPWFTNADARPSLADVFPGESEEARVYKGLKALTEQLLSRGYAAEDGGDMKVALALIDSGNWTDVVYQFCKKTQFDTRVKPSKGRGIKAGDRPMSEWKGDPRRDVVGQNWRIDADSKARHVLVDTNSWKTFVATRLVTEPPAAGCLSLFRAAEKDHELFAAHLVAEYSKETWGGGRWLREWKLRPERPDNHWWDALVLSAVAASVVGVKWDTAAVAGEVTGRGEPARRKKLSAVFREKHGELMV